MKMRSGVCQHLSGHFDKSSFRAGKGEVCCIFKAITTSGATGITLLYEALKSKFWRGVRWNWFGGEDERLKVKQESAWRVV